MGAVLVYKTMQKNVHYMPEISEAEFQRRMRQIRNARKIFAHMTDNNISVAYQLYREVFEEKDLPELLSFKKAGRKHHIVMSKYERHRCPKCNRPMMLRHICKPQGRENLYGYRSVWECINENCYYERYSKLNVKQQVRRLKPKQKPKGEI